MSQQKNPRKSAMHRGRVNKQGKPFDPRHNDRQFDTSKAPQIDSSLSKDNKYFYWNESGQQVTDTTLQEHELGVYERMYQAACEVQNEKNNRTGHGKRNKNFTDIYTGKNTAPERIQMQVGRQADGNQPDRATLEACVMEYIEWHRKQYPNIVIMSATFHYDEPEAGDHFDLSQTYWVENEDGNKVAAQGKALEAMGIEVQENYTGKLTKQVCNRKTTYTRETREKWYDILEEHGIEIDRTPKEASKSGVAFDEHKRQLEQEKLKALQEQQQQALENIQKLTADVQKKIKPERKGLFQKTDNFVMDKEQYEQVCEALESIRTYSKKATENGTATDKARKEAEEARKQAELSKQQEQEHIKEQALEMVKQLEQQTIRERNKAKKEREAAEADRIHAEGELEAAKRTRENADSIVRERVEEALTERLEELNRDGYVKELRAALKVHKNPLTNENALAEFERKKKEQALSGLDSKLDEQATYRRSKTRSDDDYSRG